METTTKTETGIESRGVLAEAYGKRTPEKAMLKHSYDMVADRPLCKAVKAEHIADHYSDIEGNDLPPTCTICLKRDPRFNGKR